MIIKGGDFKNINMTLNKLASEIHQNNRDKGFYDKERNLSEILCLIHSEVSEALEAVRSYKSVCEGDMKELRANGFDEGLFKSRVKGTFEDEIADIIIRTLDLAAYQGIDIQSHIEMKLRYNKTRPHKHGKSF